MYEEHIQVIETSLNRAIDKVGKKVLSRTLFDLFFERYPETQSFFEETDIDSFGPQKFSVITEFLIDVLKHPDYAEVHLGHEVQRHTVYGLKDREYYFTLIDVMQESVKRALDDAGIEIPFPYRTLTFSEPFSALLPVSSLLATCTEASQKRSYK